MALATVRLSNCTCSFPTCSFHEDSRFRGAIEDQLDQVHQPVLAVQLGFRQLSPATVTPTLASMRPEAPYDPAIEPVEELADVGSVEDAK